MTTKVYVTMHSLGFPEIFKTFLQRFPVTETNEYSQMIFLLH